MYWAIDDDNHRVIGLHPDPFTVADLAWLYSDRGDLGIRIFHSDNLIEINELSDETLDALSLRFNIVETDRLGRIKAIGAAMENEAPPIVNGYLLSEQIKVSEKDRTKFYGYQQNSLVPKIL